MGGIGGLDFQLFEGRPVSFAEVHYSTVCQGVSIQP